MIVPVNQTDQTDQERATFVPRRRDRRVGLSDILSALGGHPSRLCGF